MSACRSPWNSPRLGFDVTGIDLSESKVAKVNAGESYIADIPEGVFKPLVDVR